MNELEQWSMVNSFVRNRHHSRLDIEKFFTMHKNELSWSELLEHLKIHRPRVYNKLARERPAVR